MLNIKAIALFMLCITLTTVLAGATQNVQCEQHGTAVLEFHFSFISGPEDLIFSWIKLETIDGDTDPVVICFWYKGAVEYQADQYRNRTEVHADESSGNLELILKDVEKSDEGLYKCQATGMKSHREKIYELYIQNDAEPDKTFPHGKDILFITIVFLVIFFSLLIYYHQQKLNRGNRVRFMVFAGILLVALVTALGLFCYWHKYGAKPNKQSRNLVILVVSSLVILAVSLVFFIFHFYKKYQRKNSIEEALAPGQENHECSEEDVPLNPNIQVWSIGDVLLKPGMPV